MRHKLHVWGGLGSQLTGLFVQRYLGEKFNELSISLVIHQDELFEYNLSATGYELSEAPLAQNVILKNDYAVPSHQRSFHYDTSKLVLKRMNSFRHVLMRKSGIGAVNLKSVSNARLTKWRSNIYIDNIALDINTKALNKFIIDLALKNKTSPQDLIVHWRLGDLHFNSTKSAGNLDLLPVKLVELVKSTGVYNVKVFTESVEIAKHKILVNENELLSALKIEFCELKNNAWNLLEEGVNGKVFVGTYSKLTMWVVAARCAMGLRELTFLPIGALPAYTRLFPDLKNCPPSSFLM